MDGASSLGGRVDRTPVKSAGVGTRISGNLGALAGHIVTTASATYARIGIGSVEAKVLFVLDDGPMTAARISKALGMDRAAISRTVKALVERGLIDRSDGAVTDLTLTDKGRMMHQAVRCIAEERERRLLSRFSDAEQAMLADYLTRLAANMSDLSKLADEMAGRDRIDL